MTNELQPQYFTKFSEDFNKFRKEVNERFDGLDKKIDEVIENQETHFEAIGEVKVKVTGIEELLEKKADASKVKEIEYRTKVLEDLLIA